MNETLQNLMRRATQLTRSGRLNEAMQSIQRALGRAAPPPTAPGRAVDAAVAAFSGPLSRPTAAVVLDGCVVEIADPVADSPAPTRPAAADPGAAVGGRGEFSAGTIGHSGALRFYKLYTPPGAAGRQLPLVVMLHGCTQNPDDFATGTGINVAARERGFFVLYPAQSTEANPTGCWNWFKHNHQQRGRGGEPDLIAAMTNKVVAENNIDPRRVYVAGLSAGGAMAAIVGAEYPDLFAAVGVHSGLAAGAATNLPDALAAMRGGASGALTHPLRRPGAAESTVPNAKALPTIVFHGDSDAMVHPRNGEAVVAAAVGGIDSTADASATSRSRVEQGRSAAGRPYTRTVHSASDGSVAAEHWLIHGAGHAWSGGNAAGSYTDASGPDATGEMLRFFFEHPRRAGH
jgi:poly(hydroxyalkanoate) depolymerase family esterase